MVSVPLLMLAAWATEVALGWPAWLFARIRHPVVWMGALIELCDRQLNRPKWTHPVRYVSGAVTTLVVVSIVTGLAWGLSVSLPKSWWGILLQIIIASSLIASRSLYMHIVEVARPLARGNLTEARGAVAKIVGRDPDQLDEAGIARASLESLAENMSDGVVAPLFWGACLGLPGLAAYKAINTLDSMIGHRSDRYVAFGGFAARLDDVANLIPARISALLIAAASFRILAFEIASQDARAHRSPNAGWPEAAMAGALNVRLSGPRTYGAKIHQEPWLNTQGVDPDVMSIRAGLNLYLRALKLAALILLILGLAAV